MKEKEVFVNFKDHQLIIYTEKDDNSYGPTQTGAASTKDFLDDFREKWKNMENEILIKINSGQVSMIYYYMMLQELTSSELAVRVGISKSKVERHFQPKYFEKASLSTIKKYAEVFNIPVANLFQLVSTKEDKLWKVHYIDNEEVFNNYLISQQRTNNPLVVITKIEQKQ
jgi:transcriptional regulator with XRE-family HTH domain